MITQVSPSPRSSFFFFFNDTATTEIYTLSLHDALPIRRGTVAADGSNPRPTPAGGPLDRKSTRLNSSHSSISYAVFCLKKKKTTECPTRNIKKNRNQNIVHKAK